MNCIIFSKDRAMQLQCLLSSLYENCDIFKEVVVIYKTKHYESYEILKDEFNDVKWIAQGIFKDDLLANLDPDYSCLLVDDCIIYRKVDNVDIIAALEESDIVSLRLGDDIRPRHHFEVKSSMDGNIFPNYLLWKLHSEHFNNPNELEIRFAKWCGTKTMSWFHEQKIIGIPNNRVSDTSGCHHMGGNADELNEYYLDGYRIDWKGMDLECKNVHKDEQLKLVKVC